MATFSADHAAHWSLPVDRSVVRALLTAVVTVSATAALLVPTVDAIATGPRRHPAQMWPASGQAAYAFGAGPVHSSPRTHAAPIASMAKVMTAYLVLRAYPLTGDAAGFTLVVTGRDVADRARRVRRDESTVPVRRGERLTERQALAALLLPSANNVAVMLAATVSGTVGRFVALMNATARALGMDRSHYTDPSGYLASTTSTPADQVRLAQAATGVGFLRWMARQTSYRIPVAGVVLNTDKLLRHDGFVGLKTGSTSQAGGCFVFRSRRVVDGRVVDLYGVVMGQHGNAGLLSTAFTAARHVVDRLAPTPAR